MLRDHWLLRGGGGGSGGGINHIRKIRMNENKKGFRAIILQKSQLASFCSRLARARS